MSEASPVSSILRQLGPIEIAAWRLMLEKQAAMLAEFERAFRGRHGLTTNEFDALINIPPGQRIRHRDLLRNMVVSRSALSRILGRLEARGLVAQSTDSDDQRGVCVSLTERGESVRGAAEQTNGEIVLSAFAGLGEGESEQLFDLVSKIKPHRPRGRGESQTASEADAAHGGTLPA
ncbi:MarR family winged helix-turn-helix transcriptional regulator [Brevibacterium permense]|uniref:MarR family winged helix-turn-helix transcriptional regulator n=1 Tax=Brevibacterium permense TaxID=234834 RepID=UPI0021D24653|nr:MarR family transcriptional regulator [Brevibacterium permense]